MPIATRGCTGFSGFGGVLGNDTGDHLLGDELVYVGGGDIGWWRQEGRGIGGVALVEADDIVDVVQSMILVLGDFAEADIECKPVGFA